MKLAIATTNDHKIKEFREIFKNFDIELLTPKDLEISLEVKEDKFSFRENSIKKAKCLYKKTNIPSFADDSGICVSVLDNQPGVYSSRYGGKHLNDKQRAEVILSLLEYKINRNAFFYCSIAYYDGEVSLFFDGKCEGEITKDYLKSKNNFGYDPIFYYPPLSKRFSELDIETKNQVSHRGKAINKFINFLKSKT